MIPSGEMEMTKHMCIWVEVLLLSVGTLASFDTLLVAEFFGHFTSFESNRSTMIWTGAFRPRVWQVFNASVQPFWNPIHSLSDRVVKIATLCVQMLSFQIRKELNNPCGGALF